MNALMRSIAGPFLVLILGLFQVTPVLARSDDIIQREIEAKIAESAELQGSRIEIHVQQRLVILTGEVRLYEQKLISERIAWTTLGVFEVDNEIRVVPKLPLSDAAIERKISEIVKGNERFHVAEVVVEVRMGKVLLKGTFVGFSDPLMLKYEVAEIEGVVDIEMNAAFLAYLSRSWPAQV